MSKWDEYIQPEEDSEGLIYEEWQAYVELEGSSQPKIEDRSCTDSQRELPLTD